MWLWQGLHELDMLHWQAVLCGAVCCLHLLLAKNFQVLQLAVNAVASQPASVLQIGLYQHLHAVAAQLARKEESAGHKKKFDVNIALQHMSLLSEKNWHVLHW